MFDGYGRGWSEPLAKGRWNRFKQKMREPATKDDFAIVWVVMLAIVNGIAIAAILH
jgi:hypothetical protein